MAVAAVDAGATTINLPDTVGYALPADIGKMFTTVGRLLRDRAVLSAHCHNDLGMAVANSLAAVQAGARQVECTINGIGERAGNASLEEIVMTLEVRADALPYTTGIHTPGLVPASNTLSAIIGVSVPPNKAIVGANAFAHEAGIHQDGMLKHELTYEIMRPEDGRRSRHPARARQALGDARPRRPLPCPGPPVAPARTRGALSQGDGARRSHQDG